MSISLFRRALVGIFGAICLVLGSAAFGPLGGASAAPPEQAQNDGNGNSDSPGAGNGQGGGQDNGGGGSNTGGNGGSQASGSNSGGQGGGSTAGRQGNGGGTAGGSSESNPDGGGLDKPDCEGTAEGCQGPAPRDGNNGCGNEAEPKSVRDDDNNGNCGGGREKDEDGSDSTVAAAGAAAAWTAGDPAEVIAASLERTRQGAQAFDPPAKVMGVTAERAGFQEVGGDVDVDEEVDLEDLELARERVSRGGERSLLALTGMALMTLLAIGLFTIGVGRLLRGVEGDAS